MCQEKAAGTADVTAVADRPHCLWLCTSPPCCWARGFWSWEFGRGLGGESACLCFVTPRASAAASAGVTPGMETVQGQEAEATCRLPHSQARAIASRG